jgi:hypothetical protein
MNEPLADVFARAAQGQSQRPDGRPWVGGEVALSLHDLLHLHGSHSGAVVLMLLALLCCIPVAGVGTVLSVGILVLAWQWSRVHEAQAPSLNPRLGRIALNAKWSQRCLHGLAWLYRSADRWLAPRWRWMFHPAAAWLWRLWIATMALIIFMPLPLGNVLPGLSLVLLSLAWTFRDGLALLASAVVGGGGIGLCIAFFHVLSEAAHRALGMMPWGA